MSGTCNCGALSARNKSGRCRPCSARAIFHTPGSRERATAAIRAKFDDPEHRARWARQLKINAATERSIEMKREHGRRQYREILSRPEVQAVIQSDEAKAKRGASVTNTKLGWCPQEHRDEYRHLMRSKRLSAADARKAIETKVAEQEQARLRFGLDPAAAARHVQTRRPVYRCTPEGAQQIGGTHWRCGSAVLDAGGVIDLALSLGWDAHAWKRAA